MNPVDAAVLNFIESIQHPLITEIMYLITNLVSYSVLFLFFLLIMYKGRKKVGSQMFMGLLVESIVVISLKWIIGRPRPVSGSVKEFGNSFPSGHTSRSTFLALIFSDKWGKRIFWYSFTGLIMFSRLYLQVHYFTDLVGGIIVGSCVYWAVKRYDLGEKGYNTFQKKKEEFNRKIQQVFK